jgi:hypothetical protein
MPRDSAHRGGPPLLDSALLNQQIGQPPRPRFRSLTHPGRSLRGVIALVVIALGVLARIGLRRDGPITLRIPLRVPRRFRRIMFTHPTTVVIG